MTNEELKEFLLRTAFRDGDEYAKIYNRVAMKLYNDYEITSTVLYMLVARVIFDLKGEKRI